MASPTWIASCSATTKRRAALPQAPRENSRAVSLGGAVSSGNDGNLTVKNCWFTGNKAIGGFRHYPNPLYTVGGGGALDNWGTAVITDSVFTDNQAIGGAAEPGVEGGYGIGGALSTGTPFALSPVCTIRHCTFSHNRAIGADAASETDNLGGSRNRRSHAHRLCAD